MMMRGLPGKETFLPTCINLDAVSFEYYAVLTVNLRLFGSCADQVRDRKSKEYLTRLVRGYCSRGDQIPILLRRY